MLKNKFRHIAQCLITPFFALFLLSFEVQAAVWDVTTVAELTTAINNSVSGDSILVADGTYTITGGSHDGNVYTLKAGVNLIGNGASKPLFTHTGYGSIFAIESVVNGDTARIENIRMKSTIGWEQGSCVKANGAHIKLKIKNCIFENSTASGSGGALYAGSNAKVWISYCDFNNCSSQSGAAIGVNNASLYISYSDLHHNNGQLGGSIYMNGGYVRVANCEIYENKVTSGSQGGAAYLTGGAKMELWYTNIVKNESLNGGSGFYLNGNGDTLILNHCTMAGNVNTSWAAGGIAGGGVIIANNSIITGNTNIGDNDDGNVSNNITVNADSSIVGNDLIVSTDPNADCQPNCTYDSIINGDSAVNVGDSGQVTITIPTVVTDPETGDTITLPIATDDNGNPNIGSGNVVTTSPPTLVLSLTDSIVCVGDSVTFTLTLKNLSGSKEFRFYRIETSTKIQLATQTNNVGSAMFGIRVSSATVTQYTGEVYDGANLEVAGNSKTLMVIPITKSSKIEHSKNTVDN